MVDFIDDHRNSYGTLAICRVLPIAPSTYYRAKDLSDNPKDVIHHSDRGVQYLSIRYTDKMADCGVIASVGTTGDSYDNALAETVNGLYKSEVIYYLKESWIGVNDVELATLEWVDWFNKKRLHSTIGYVSPLEFEKRYYDSLILSGIAA